MKKSTHIRSLMLAMLFAHATTHAEEPASEPQGWLFKSVNENDLDIKVTGWVQASIADSNHGGQLTPATIFRRDDGVTLDQAAIMVEKKVESNIVSRVGAFPGPMPQEFDWGFNITGMYGADNFFFRTYGLDDDWGSNKVGNFGSSDMYATLTQAYAELYLPVLGGSNLMVGLFHTPLINEIGFALPAPAPTTFYTHPYSFIHGPAKHVGALWSSHILNEPGSATLSYELGAVRGHNNLQDPNKDWDVIANLRWRSKDFSTWVDFENIFGNGADDSFAKCGCGSPIPASSELAKDKKLNRYQSYLTVTKFLNPKNSVTAEASYGYQEKALLADVFNAEPFGVPANGGKDASWQGINVSYKHNFNPQLSSAIRAEYFDTDGVHVLVPYDGIYKAVTANMTWNPKPYLRVRPEIRYDWYSGGSKPFASPHHTLPPLINGTEDDQLSYSLDLTFFF
ncbi:outer membrane beta-barrel protein [Acinetobacter baumannii]|uniref:Porin n=1 Tax=Acinetobacter towneri TaxID=202956 RepID=A0A142ECU6_9GAMM|nr:MULTISPECIES: outer membrane beta-barrel protein [Acinetobacter]AMQ45984.1 hypothetical protein [Acinetobacter towneri]MCJ8793672.1 porin [Acinetobacter baumannii]MCJ8903785.1 porin [Acinetobacter baumannii]HDX5899213.1 outer membrane beta-barrel protein [Acinetobacter baumannii]